MTQTETGDLMVDFYMSIALDHALPKQVRLDARRKLMKAALRPSGFTVQDVIKETEQ